MLQVEHSAILSTSIKLPIVIEIFVLSIFEWPFSTSIKLPIVIEIFVVSIFEWPFYTGFVVH